MLIYPGLADGFRWVAIGQEWMWHANVPIGGGGESDRFCGEMCVGVQAGAQWDTCDGNGAKPERQEECAEHARRDAWSVWTVATGGRKLPPWYCQRAR